MRPNFSLPGLLCPRKSVLPQPGGFGRKSVEWTSRSHGARQNHHGGGQTRPSSPSTGSHAARPSDSIEFLVGLVRAQGPLPPPPCGGFSFRRSRPLGQRLRRQSHSHRRGMGVRGWRPQKPWPVAFCASTRHLFPPHRGDCGSPLCSPGRLALPRSPRRPGRVRKWLYRPSRSSGWISTPPRPQSSDGSKSRSFWPSFAWRWVQVRAPPFVESRPAPNQN